VNPSASVIAVSIALVVSVATITPTLPQTEPQGGQPAQGAKPSVSDLEEQVVYQRAFEAVIWSQPAIGIYGFRRAFKELGVQDNEIVAMSKPVTTRHELLTANNTTPYIAANGDLKSGPVVLEVPPESEKGVLFGQVVDAWQETIAAVGPSGFDHGKGGKHLFLPPGYDGTIPDDYIVVRSPNYRISFAFRSIKLPGMTDEDAHAYAQKLRMYPLAEAANPKPTRFVDTWAEPLHTLAFYDFRYFRDLYEALDGEPVRPRDKVMMGMLASLGIEADKPFDPPLKYKAAMERAVVDAYFYMQNRVYKVQSKNLFYPDRHWSFFFIPDSEGSVTFDLPSGLFYTQRADMYHPGTYYPPRVPSVSQIADWAKAGELPATAYLISMADKNGAPLEAGRLYRLRVPADMPVKQFWSLIVYDYATFAFIYNPLERVGLSTYDTAGMKKNADGSVDIYFGPKPPEGLEANFVPTQGKRPVPASTAVTSDSGAAASSSTMLSWFSSAQVGKR
jgi:hypothetical protein